jgi:hypothetical protein
MLAKEKLLTLLEEAFEAGFSAGFHSEEWTGNHKEDWEEYKKRFPVE